MIKKTILITLILLMIPVFSFAENLTVAVAANVQFAFEEIKKIFEEETGISIKPVYASSGALTAQIQHGAPFDIFLSADTEYPQTLYLQDKTYNQPKVYALGGLVLWSLTNNDLNQGITILTDPSIKKIAVPNPETAPYGNEAIKVLKHYGLYNEILKKLVYGESIAQTNQFITSRASDIGFTAKSVVLAPNMKEQGHWIEIKQEAYDPINQAVVILKFAEREHLSSAQKFYEFLFSTKAQHIFKIYGYFLP